MFLILKLIMVPIWLPLKLIGELIEHSGGSRRRHYRRHTRVAWTPGRPPLTRWSSQMMRTASVGQHGAFRLAAVPFAMLATVLAWGMLLCAWIVWWAVLVIVLPVALVV